MSEEKKTLVLPAINDKQVYLSDVMLGVFKFNAVGPRPHCTAEELAAAAQKLRKQNPGGGVFLSMDIAEAGRNELGLHLKYKFGKTDLEIIRSEDDEYLLDTYIDFWQRQMGLAYKGYEGFRSHVASVASPSVINVFERIKNLYIPSKVPAKINGTAIPGQNILVLSKPRGREKHALRRYTLHEGGEFCETGSADTFHVRNAESELQGVHSVYTTIDSDFKRGPFLTVLTELGYEYETQYRETVRLPDRSFYPAAGYGAHF